MSVFLEGVDSVVQPCTLPLLLWALVLVLAAGTHLSWAAAGYLLGLASMAWLRFTGLVPGDLAEDHSLVAAAVAVAAVSIVGFGPRGRWRRHLVVGGALLDGTVAVALWRPCVGRELGNVLSSAGDDRMGALIPTTLYMAGLGSLIAVVGLIPVAVPATKRLAGGRGVAPAGVVIGLGLAVLVAAGWWSDLVSELLLLSTP